METSQVTCPVATTAVVLRGRPRFPRSGRSIGEIGPAGRSSPKTYQTRRARASFVRATEVTRHGTTTWT
jgi:hypothetical protein